MLCFRQSAADNSAHQTLARWLPSINEPCDTGKASTVCNAHPATASATQAAVLQDLISRHSLPSPAHPSYNMLWKDSRSHGQGQIGHNQTNTSRHEPPVATLPHIELDIPNSHCSIRQTEAITHQEQQLDAPSLPAQSTSEIQQQVDKLQARMPTVDVAKAVAKHPLLLSYSLATLQKHMQQLEALVGVDAAATMVAKMPQLLHYKSSTLAAKLDRLYDLLAEADVGKVCTTCIAKHRMRQDCLYSLLRLKACPDSMKPDPVLRRPARCENLSFSSIPSNLFFLVGCVVVKTFADVACPTCASLQTFLW